jgi:hypothetical protein
MLRRIEMNSGNHLKIEKEKKRKEFEQSSEKLRRDETNQDIKVKSGKRRVNSNNPLEKLKRDEINQEHNINPTFSKY